jgi:hypothetical protein
LKRKEEGRRREKKIVKPFDFAIYEKYMFIYIYNVCIKEKKVTCKDCSATSMYDIVNNFEQKIGTAP